MQKMLLSVFILEILSFARSGRDELSHDVHTDTLDNLASDTINAQDSLLSLSFQPKILDFLQRSIGDPHNHEVILFNKHKHKKIYLGSITGSSSDFFSSYFEDKVIQPESNTTFKVVFLPRHIGATNSSLIIHTSFGVINYHVRGIGVECQYKLKPLIGIKLPLNASISPEIQLYNPHHFALQISEIFSSGGKFHLELPNVSPGGQEGDYKLWEIPPYTSKAIIRVRFYGKDVGNHTTYVRIKIAGNKMVEEKMLVVPIEIEIYNETGIYSQVPLLDFGMVGIDDGVRHYVYNLLNSGHTSISIKNWGIESDIEQVENSQCVVVDVVQFSRRNFTDHFTVKVDWSKCPNIPRVVTGNVFLMSDISSYDEVDEVTYRIPFSGHIIKGNLSYKSSDLMFLRSDKKSYETSRSIIIKNNYNVPLAITNLTVPENCARYFKLTGFKPIVLQPGSLMKLLDIQPLSAVQFAANQTTIEESFRIATNVTYYDIPIKSYTGLLRRIVPVDFERERSQVDEKALNFGALLPVSKNSELLIAFVNDNPIPIDIKSWKGTITSGSGQAQITSLQRGCSKMSLEDLEFCNSNVKSKEWVIFAISVQSPVVGTFDGNFLLKTPFEEINTPVRFSTAMGRLELKSKMIFDDCFPGKICSLNIEAYSTFMKKMYVEGIAVDMDGISYEFAVKGPNELPEILPNVDTDVGKLFFNPKDVLCKKRATCYTSFDALSRPVGETWMRTLTNYTAYSRWDNERMKVQLNSFMEVKQSLKQMQFRLTTSQIRRYEFNASINFVWPRLMKSNVEFPFYQINKLETRFIEIYNPSNQIIFIHFVLHNVSRFGDKTTVLPEALRDCPECVLSLESPFTFNSTNKETFMEEVGPRSYLKVGVDFFATSPGTYSTLLYMRNNLTVVEAVWLSARAVVPQFKFGNRMPGSTTPLQFEINEKHLKLCEKKPSTGASVTVSSKRTFTARNFGEVPLMINAMRIENDLCMGYGFKVHNCEPFQLMPNESKKIEIAFAPDYTLSRVVRTLNFETSIGSNVNFTLIGTVATSALELCGKNIQRPPWEAEFKRNALIVLWAALLVVVVASVLDSDGILEKHMKIISKERGPIQPPLDLRQIGLESNSCSESVQCFGSNQERLNKLNNHQTSLNNIRKRLTMTKKNCVTPEPSAGRFSLNKPWADFRNKFTSSTKVTTASTPKSDNSNKTSPRPARHDISKEKTRPETNSKESKKTSEKTSEDDSVSSSSSKENCEISLPKGSFKAEQSPESPLLGKSKNPGKKNKNLLNISDNVKDNKVTNNNNVLPMTPFKPLAASQAQNKNQQVTKETKQKLTNNTTSVCNVKPNEELKSHSPTSNASSSEGHHQNHHASFNDIITFTNGHESMNLLKNEQLLQQQQQQQQQLKKHGKTPGRELKAGMNLAQINNRSNSLKKAPSKDKQFAYRQNLSSVFANNGKLNNNHQGGGQNNIWLPPATTVGNGNSIWSTSYSDVVAKTPIEPTPMNHVYGMKNEMVNGHRHPLELAAFNRMNSFNYNSDRYIDQEGGSQYGPIGTKKSPSSTPSWEPLAAGNNHYNQLAKPSPYNNASFFSQPIQPVLQQSRLMSLMSYNDTSAQQQQQQQQNHAMEEQYRYHMLQMQEQKQNEWRSPTVPSNSYNLWSPTYGRPESPTAPPSSNWSTPSPPLAVPPGFEQQFQQQNVAQPNHQNDPSTQAYDPFKSFNAI